MLPGLANRLTALHTREDIKQSMLPGNRNFILEPYLRFFSSVGSLNTIKAETTKTLKLQQASLRH